MQEADRYRAKAEQEAATNAKASKEGKKAEEVLRGVRIEGAEAREGGVLWGRQWCMGGGHRQE